MDEDPWEAPGAPGSFDNGDPNSTNIFVSNLAPSVTEDVLHKEFSRCAGCDWVCLGFDWVCLGCASVCVMLATACHACHCVSTAYRLWLPCMLQLSRNTGLVQWQASRSCGRGRATKPGGCTEPQGLWPLWCEWPVDLQRRLCKMLLHRMILVDNRWWYFELRLISFVFYDCL